MLTNPMSDNINHKTLSVVGTILDFSVEWISTQNFYIFRLHAEENLKTKSELDINRRTIQQPTVWKRMERRLNYCTIPLISHTSNITLRISQCRLEPYIEREMKMFNLASEKTKEQGTWQLLTCVKYLVFVHISVILFVFWNHFITPFQFKWKTFPDSRLELPLWCSGLILDKAESFQWLVRFITNHFK